MKRKLSYMYIYEIHISIHMKKKLLYIYTYENVFFMMQYVIYGYI